MTSSKCSILEFFQILFLMKRQYPLPSYPKPAPRPVIRKVENNQSPSAEMRKWLLEGHFKNLNSLESQNKNIIF